MKLTVAFIVVFLISLYPREPFVWFIIAIGILESISMLFEERSNRKRL